MKPAPNSRWRHYKSTGGNNHLYEVIWVVKHSETEEELVLYRPLYEVTPESWAYGYEAVVRPLSLWHDTVDWNGKKMARFTEE